MNKHNSTALLLKIDSLEEDVRKSSLDRDHLQRKAEEYKQQLEVV